MTESIENEFVDDNGKLIEIDIFSDLSGLSIEEIKTLPEYVYTTLDKKGLHYPNEVNYEKEGLPS